MSALAIKPLPSIGDSMIATLTQLTTEQVMNEYKEAFISKLNMMYSDFETPDIKACQTLASLEFVLQADPIWTHIESSKFNVICSYLGTEPYSSFFGKLAMYVEINGKLYKYVYRVPRVMINGSRVKSYGLTYETKELIEVYSLGNEQSIHIKETLINDNVASRVEKEMTSLIKQYISGTCICTELDKVQKQRKYKLYYLYRSKAC